MGMSPIQQAVQSGHAVAEYLLKNKDCEWYNGTLVYLRVKSEIKLKWLIFKLESRHINYVSFREPDMNNKISSVAVLGNSGLFKNYKLL